MTEQVYDLDLSLGFKTFRIRFADINETAEIAFNPSDMDLPNRLLKAKERIQNAIDSIVESDDELADEEYIQRIDAFNNTVRNEMDYVFGNSVSDKVFAYCAPFSLVNGKPFIVQFLDQITPVVRKIIEKDYATSMKAISKHTAKYESK